ncbi:hypothetical protein [Pseudarthrobacter sp. NIBRBAC000502770]|uniref:hypothetical protein n=1 Tax=Pseudarthrobacter sp. NIBRBAC000502770 TaxID=2590785 RepID=UPI0011408F91|nr:hypothetical protein [Pseudarthrobacter sp. NIBRBAC000502770]QDG88079.1 hypothetical protein NIBR502770_05965 [Pseudarthrobacter sp. NIBRBAC000502770]
MTIDLNAAGLLAQVIPALLVFLALEDRLSPVHIPRPKVRQWLRKWREAAVVLNLVSLFLCLATVVTRTEFELFGIFISFSMIFLLAVLVLLFAGMFAREDEPVPQSAAAEE